MAETKRRCDSNHDHAQLSFFLHIPISLYLHRQATEIDSETCKCGSGGAEAFGSCRPFLVGPRLDLSIQIESGQS